MTKPRYKYVGYRPEDRILLWGFVPGTTMSVDSHKWRGATMILRAAAGIFLVHPVSAADRVAANHEKWRQLIALGKDKRVASTVCAV